MQENIFEETFDALQDKHYHIHGYKKIGEEFDPKADNLRWQSKRRYSRAGVNQFIFRWLRTAKKTKKKIDYFNIEPPLFDYHAPNFEEVMENHFASQNKLVERE